MWYGYIFCKKINWKKNSSTTKKGTEVNIKTENLILKKISSEKMGSKIFVLTVGVLENF